MADRRRSRPIRVLALGMSRTGTESLRRALTTLGLHGVYHGFVTTTEDLAHAGLWVQAIEAKFEGKGVLWEGAEMWDRILGNYEATTDFPCAAFAPELIAAYPSALVILNSRDVDDWYASCIAVITKGGGSFWNRMEWMMTSEMMRAGILWHKIWQFYFRGSFIRNGKCVFKEHEALVRGLMAGRQDELLEWQLGDGWEPLCKFLNVEVPDEPYPTGNTLVETQSKMLESLKVRRPQAIRNIVIASAGLFTFSIGLFIGARRFGKNVIAFYTF